MKNFENKIKNEMSLSDETQFQTDNLSRILKSSCPTAIGHLSRILKSSCPTAIGHLSRIKKEIALEFGSRLPSCPRMTLFLLAFLLSLSIISESQAGCYMKDHGYINNCYTWSNNGSCGKGCSYIYDSNSKTVYITASGDDAKLDFGKFSKHAYEGGIFPPGVSIDNFVVDGKIATSFGAFYQNDKITKVKGKDNVLILSEVGPHTFNSILQGQVVITSNAEIDYLAFYEVYLAENAKIYCAVENCAQKIIDSCKAYSDNTTVNKCLLQVQSIISSQAKFAQVDNGFEQVVENCAQFSTSACLQCKDGYLEKDGACVSSEEGCGAGYRQIENWCNRIRYTPAEAAQVLRDDDKNEIVITFKK